MVVSKVKDSQSEVNELGSDNVSGGKSEGSDVFDETSLGAKQENLGENSAVPSTPEEATPSNDSNFFIIQTH